MLGLLRPVSTWFPAASSSASSTAGDAEDESPDFASGNRDYVAPAVDDGVYTEQDIADYAAGLGLDPILDSDLLWIARQALEEPLPAGWSEQRDAADRAYFYSELTQESSWCHPVDAIFRELVHIVKAVRSATPFASAPRRTQVFERHVAQAHRRALAQAEKWSGPYYSEEGEHGEQARYYYNEDLDVSSWTNPSEGLEAELAILQSVLHRCLVSEWKEPVAHRRTASAASTPLKVTGMGSLSCTSTTYSYAGRAPLASCRSRSSSVISFRSACSARSTRSIRSARGRRTGGCSPSPARRCRASPSVSPKRTQSVVSASMTVKDASPVYLQLGESSGLPKGDLKLEELENTVVSGATAASAPECVVRRRCPSTAEAVAASFGEGISLADTSSTSLDMNLEVIITAFAADLSCTSLELPPALSAEQRRRAKELAESHPGLRCESFGFGVERRLHLFKNVPAEAERPRSFTFTTAAAASASEVEVTFGHGDDLQLKKERPAETNSGAVGVDINCAGSLEV
eukprot:TRINITY_DN112840_c0_g1_i1.p1 TRINITY_DN112840_c0_g1~~TRINITY_DN112840_c0_g1_i1.p1  ORF type:complete len:518 (-),score=65.82 TRINITY_DN112840_c0_g1_i1:103-1656(-)